MIVIGNGRLITRDDENTYFDDGAVAVEGTQIVEVGPTEEIVSKYPDADFVDAHHGVIMPGLINTHHHIYSTFARGLSIDGYDPKNFMDILEGQWWTIDNNLSLDEVEQSARDTYIDCIKNGVTTVFDHHANYMETKGSLDRIGKAAEDLGVRTSLCYEISDRNGEEKMKEAVQENVDWINKAQADETGMKHGMMGLHASFTCSDETLDYCNSVIPEGAGYHVHVAEGMDDVNDAKQKYGKGVVERLNDKGILGPNSFAVHCVHISDDEMDILKENGCTVVHNPESNMGNAVGCPRVMDIVHKGIVAGLGTDGYTSDMLESYKVANILHKHANGDPNAAWGEIPEMLFVNNRKIAEKAFNRKLGVLEPGAQADIIVTDYIPTTPMHKDNYNSHILFGMNGRSVIDTMIDGKLLMKDRELIGIDEEAEMEKSRALAKEMADRINSPERNR